MSENVQNKIDALEVEVIIPKEVLESDQELSMLYDEKSKKIKYNIAPETTNQLREQIKSMIVGAPNANALVVINPIIAALSYIQGFKELQYDPEKKNSQDYTDAKTKLGTFNAAVKKACDTIKAPLNDYRSVVIELEKLLKEESANVRSALDTNFKEYLDEKAKIEAEKIAKRDKEKNDTIAALSAENEQNLAKLTNQKKQTRKIEVESIINKLGSDVAVQVPKLNLQALETYRAEILNSKLGEVDTPEVTFDREELTEFNQKWAEAVLAAVAIIDIAIQAFKEAEKTHAAEKRTEEVINKATAAGFSVDDDDMPFIQAPVVPEPEEVRSLDTDADKFHFIVDELERGSVAVDSIVESILGLEFEDENIKKLQAKLSTSLGSVKDMMDKTTVWTREKHQQYINFLNSK